MISIEQWRARIGSFNNKQYSGSLSSLFSSSSYYYYHPRKRRNLSREHSQSTVVSTSAKAGLTSSSSFLMDIPSAEKHSSNTCISEKASSEPSTTASTTSIPSSSAGIQPSSSFSSSSSSFPTITTFSSLFSRLFSIHHSLLRDVLIILLIAIISQQLIISGDIETNPGPKRTADDKPDLSDLLYMSYTGDDGRDVHFRLMDQLKPHWRRLAIALKFPQHEIAIIENDKDPVYYLLKEWLRGAIKEKDSRPASWRTLIEALRHANVQEEATVLEEKLIPGLKAADNPPRESQDIDKEYPCHKKLTPGSESSADSNSVVNEVWLPPDQPSKPEITGMTHNSLRLKWSKPKHGADIVQSYTLSYCCVDDLPYQWSTQTCSEEYSMLTKLIPGSVYWFKVSANSRAGPSPASEVSEVMLPPDKPGTPHVSGVTHTSLQLTWAKPKHGAGIVQSYTISYHSVDSPDNQLCTQTISGECLVLTNLTPGLLYHIKVTANSSAGSSPGSEMGEVRLPPGQPGKPHASRITHSSIQLEWAKPKHGAEIVEHYTLSYQSPDGQWCKKKVDEDFSVLLNLSPPGSLYRFKVVAESSAGPSPSSEVSMFRLSPDQPGKPVASDATYNSMCLKWTKPKHGAETVQSYAISGQAANDQCLNIETTSKHEYMTVTKLNPKTVYTFKVRAVSAAGHGPDSELSDPIETTLPPPGKPNASNVTHNSLQLNWEKPSHGAKCVQFYTVSYRTGNHSQDQWNTKRTPVAMESIQLVNLFPKTVYYFKVRAESATGPSPDSEFSEPIVTVSPISQPGKPIATKVTHESITLRWEKPEHGADDVKYYILDYCALDRQDRWFTYKRHGPQASVCLTGLQPKTIYIFKVRAETVVASSLDSKFSGPIETNKLPPPGKPYASKLSYTGFQVNWQQPCYGDIHHYIVSYRTTDEPSNNWHIVKTADNNSSIFFNGTEGNLYMFKVAAVTAVGESTDSEVSDAIKTKPVPLGVKICRGLDPISKSNPPIYLLPTHCVMKQNDIVKLHVEANSHWKKKPGIHTSCSCQTRTAGVQRKVLMLVGATGAGKTTLINGMANYILGVQWDDDFRFKLIDEPNSQDQYSQTTCITAYTFYKEKGSILPYTLTVIDTPGFGDTAGIDRDKKIIEQIKELFSISGDEGIDQIHGIGFVTQAPLAQLTPTQQYMFDTILSVFGRDVAGNIFLMITFADGKKPPALDAVQAAGVPYQAFFKFNNSALFASKSADDEVVIMFWKMSTKSSDELFKQFCNAQAQSLQLSREVIQERETLEVTIQGLQPQIKLGLSKIDDLQRYRKMLKDYEADILKNKDFTSKIRMVQLPPGTYTIVCLVCHYTCHDDCSCSNDDDKYKCTAMAVGRGTRSATCGVCPGKCSWKVHKSQSYRYEIYQDYETRTAAMFSKEQLECVIKKMKKELDTLNVVVLRKMEKVRRSVLHLQEIALKPNYLTEVEYIDLIIESEKREAKPRWLERVQVLECVRQQAEIITMSMKTPPQAQQQYLFSIEETVQEARQHVADVSP